MDLIILTAIIFVMTQLWLWIDFYRAEKQLGGITGPLALPVVGNIWQFAKVPYIGLINLLDSLHFEYGTLYRTWRGTVPVIHVADAKHMEIILSNSVNLKKGPLYYLLEPWLGTGLLTSHGKKWYEHRKLITPTFHFKILETFIEGFYDNTQILIKKLTYSIGDGKQIDICPYISDCTLDIICGEISNSRMMFYCQKHYTKVRSLVFFSSVSNLGIIGFLTETAMGTKVNAQTSGDSSYVNAVFRVSKITVDRNFSFHLLPDIIFYNTKLGKEYVKQVKIIHSFTENVIRNRKELRKRMDQSNEKLDDVGVKKKRAFLDLLLDANENEIGTKLSDVDIREEVDTFMFEGHDTTTAAICWTLYLLSSHETIQEQVYEEIKRIFSDDDTREATMNDLNEMKYLERVIKESLRLYPSVPFITRELDLDVTLGKRRIPAGSFIALHIRHLHQDPEQFPEPEKFNPDRFLPENIKKRHPYSYLPFSAGSRNCIGQKFALLEEKVILSELIKKFKFSTQENMKSSELRLELVLKPKDGLKLFVTKRK